MAHLYIDSPRDKGEVPVFGVTFVDGHAEVPDTEEVRINMLCGYYGASLTPFVASAKKVAAPAAAVPAAPEKAK